MYADYIQEGGVTKYNGSEWTTYSVADGLVDQQVKRIAVDNNDNIWVATGNGISKISTVTGINNTKEQNIAVYPNPATDKLFINLANNKMITIQISDLLGHVVLNQKISNSTAINVELLQSGVYVLKTKEGNKIHTQKLIVE